MSQVFFVLVAVGYLTAYGNHTNDVGTFYVGGFYEHQEDCLRARQVVVDIGMLPNGFDMKRYASATASCPIADLANMELNFYGLVPPSTSQRGGIRPGKSRPAPVRPDPKRRIVANEGG